ncbi:MAG TPA: hypothetical protein VEC11_14880 [Allosphingosinicella sp.]|nr:hypothetical protein [Allosphingosinicella sp.]
MRLAPLLCATALALVAVTAAAQGDAPPAGNGLNGLSEALEGLSDNNAQAAEPPPAEPAANSQEAVVSEPATAAPAEAQPAPQETQPAAEQPPAQDPAPPPPPPPPPPPARPPIVMPPEPLTRAQLAELQAAATRGRLLGMIERAGRAGTQDMLSHVSNPDGAGISGWIAEAEGNGTSVTFYADTDAGPVIVYRVTFNGGRAVDRDIHLAGTRPALNPLQARMAAARAVAARQEHRPCGADQFNYFVVPPLTPDGPVDVYQISPQTQRNVYPLGGHFRTSVAADGSVVATRGYTNACVSATVTDPPAGARPAPIAVTHLMDPLPQDIHPFLSAWTGHPLLVVAGDPQRLFAVTPEGIAEVPRSGPGR